ncbi:hypothetical protein HPP92_015077 [Vanilla planifolia]|uniref:Protein kinase domain-containing protein n=1 Tax=Vanilla planifolia TaxID=51239 RepID=A0A835UXH9_VANPL|nr:hypothetical protein HPP92_015077 [Vanilla planifolia]
MGTLLPGFLVDSINESFVSRPTREQDLIIFSESGKTGMYEWCWVSFVTEHCLAEHAGLELELDTGQEAVVAGVHALPQAHSALGFLLPPSSSSSTSAIPPENMTSFGKRFSLKVIIAIAAGVSALLLFVIIILLYSLRTKGRKANRTEVNSFEIARNENPKDDYSSGTQASTNKKLVFLEGCSYKFGLEDLLSASAEALGMGPNGATFKVALEDGTTVVVKRLKPVGIGKKEFKQKMEIIGKLGKHPNIAPLLAYYYSEDEKLMVYGYVSTGILSNILHGDEATERARLDWTSRLRIALAVAHGLAHIHRGKGGKLVHGNIKSSNILLSREHDACITDVGLAAIMRAPASLVLQRATVRRRPFNRESSLRNRIFTASEWVQSVLREEWTAEVFDVELIRYRNVEELIRMLQIAMDCVAGVPDQRPNIEQVIQMIQEVRPSGSDYWPSSEDTSKG